MLIYSEAARLFNLVQGDGAIGLVGNHPRHNSAHTRNTSSFIVKNVRPISQHYRVTFSLAECHHGDSVCLGSTCHKQCCLFTKQFGDVFLELVGCGTVTVDVVTNDGVSHCVTHLVTRPGHCV